jgi:hypothetical protein
MAQFSPNGNKVKNIVAIVQRGISLPFVAFGGEFSNFYNFFCYIYIFFEFFKLHGWTYVGRHLWLNFSLQYNKIRNSYEKLFD